MAHVVILTVWQTAAQSPLVLPRRRFQFVGARSSQLADRPPDTQEVKVTDEISLRPHPLNRPLATVTTADWTTEFPWKSHFLDLDGHKYAYIDEGSGDAPIVCVHGNPTWSFYWRRLIEHYSPRQRVIAVDHIGCGRSDKPQAYNYALAQHRDNLLSLIERLDLRNVTLVVHDWGGAIGLAAATRAADRFSRFVITNTGAFPPPYIPWRIAACRWPIIGRLAVRGGNAFARAAVTMATARYRRLPGKAAAGLLAPYDNWRNRVAIDAFVQDIPMHRKHPTHQVLETLESALPSLANKQILLVWGMLDWCFRPECLRRFQQVWPAAHAVELNDVGHYVMEDAPAELLTAMDEFLSNERL